MHPRGNVHEVNGRTEEDGIGLLDFFQNWCQIILDNAGPMFLVLPFTVKAADAAFIVQTVQIDTFRIGTD